MPFILTECAMIIIKNSLKIICLWLSVSFSISCSYCHFAPPQVKAARAACSLACDKRLEDCRQNCYNSCRCCRKEANLVKARNYSKYKREQCVQGYEVVRICDAYREPLRCSKTTCNCIVDYQVCQKACAIKTGL
jgi:hypothetical protein